MQESGSLKLLLRYASLCRATILFFSILNSAHGALMGGRVWRGDQATVADSLRLRAGNSHYLLGWQATFFALDSKYIFIFIYHIYNVSMYEVYSHFFFFSKKISFESLISVLRPRYQWY